MNRWLDWGIYHAGGLDSLLGATRWVQSPAEQDDYAATELFFVRDHLGSPALAMQAKRTLVSGETYRWELLPVESYEYAPYGDPTIHVPATDGSPQSAGRLALKAFETFSMSGEKSTESLLDRNDVGRPNGSTGNTWTRSGAVSVAKSFLGWSHLFTGRPWDADVRQYYIRHRWYEPLTGRWTAVDPIRYSGGLHQYQYCSADPVCVIDPQGQDVVFVEDYGGWGHEYVFVQDPNDPTKWRKYDFGGGLKSGGCSNSTSNQFNQSDVPQSNVDESMNTAYSYLYVETALLEDQQIRDWIENEWAKENTNYSAPTGDHCRELPDETYEKLLENRKKINSYAGTGFRTRRGRALGELPDDDFYDGPAEVMPRQSVIDTLLNVVYDIPDPLQYPPLWNYY